MRRRTAVELSGDRIHNSIVKHASEHTPRAEIYYLRVDSGDGLCWVGETQRPQQLHLNQPPNQLNFFRQSYNVGIVRERAGARANTFASLFGRAANTDESHLTRRSQILARK